MLLTGIKKLKVEITALFILCRRYRYIIKIKYLVGGLLQGFS